MCNGDAAFACYVDIQQQRIHLVMRERIRLVTRERICLVLQERIRLVLRERIRLVMRERIQCLPVSENACRVSRSTVVFQYNVVVVRCTLRAAMALVTGGE